MELSQQDLLKALIVIPAQVTAITFAQTHVNLIAMAALALAGKSAKGRWLWQTVP